MTARQKSDAELLANRVVTQDGCWIWQGAPHRNGYGYVQRTPERELAHRWFYERLVGPIPEGRHLDHLCRVRLCVNPGHLEPVTQAENNRRAMAVRDLRSVCRNGHEATPGERCQLCKRDRSREWAQRYRARLREQQQVAS
jgi:hypothetical protein